MVSTGDILRVKDVQTLTNVEDEMINVYFFEVTAILGAPVLNNLGEFVEAWWYQGIIPLLTPTQSSSLAHVRLEVDNLMDFAEEFVVVTPDTPVSGESLSSYVSPMATYSLQLERQFRTTRNGRKGIPGVASGLVVNKVIAPTAIEDLLAFGEAIVSPPAIDTGTGVSISMRGVIVRATANSSIPPTIINPIIGVNVRGIGSQGTRRSLGNT